MVVVGVLGVLWVWRVDLTGGSCFFLRSVLQLVFRWLGWKG
jgi:hypothetical protein